MKRYDLGYAYGNDMATKCLPYDICYGTKCVINRHVYDMIYCDTIN